jgi:hypothetical protein
MITKITRRQLRQLINESVEKQLYTPPITSYDSMIRWTGTVPLNPMGQVEDGDDPKKARQIYDDLKSKLKDDNQAIHHFWDNYIRQYVIYLRYLRKEKTALFKNAQEYFDEVEKEKQAFMNQWREKYNNSKQTFESEGYAYDFNEMLGVAHPEIRAHKIEMEQFNKKHAEELAQIDSLLDSHTNASIE